MQIYQETNKRNYGAMTKRITSNESGDSKKSKFGGEGKNKYEKPQAAQTNYNSYEWGNIDSKAF
jgi:hypothetical protein